MIVIVSAISGFICGYAFRGLIHRELTDAGSVAHRLESAVERDEASLRAEVSKIVEEIKARL